MKHVKRRTLKKWRKRAREDASRAFKRRDFPAAIAASMRAFGFDLALVGRCARQTTRSVRRFHNETEKCAGYLNETVTEECAKSLPWAARIEEGLRP